MTTATIPIKAKSNGEVKPPKQEVEFQQLAFCDEAVNYLFKFFMTPDIWDHLCDDDKNGAFIFDVAEGLKMGRHLMLVPMVNGDPCGLLYGYFMNGALMEVHFGIFPEYRKRSVEITRKAIEKGFEISNAHSMIGIIPVSNKRAVYCIQMSGFRIVDKLEKYFKKNGELEPAYVLIKENNNG